MIRSVALGLSGLVLGVAVPAAAQDTLTIGVAVEASAPSFQEVRIPVWVDMRKVPGERLGSFTVRMTWADSVLRYRRVVSRQFNNVQVRTDSTSQGIVKVAGISVSGVDSIVTLFDLVLDHSFAAHSQSGLGIQPVDLSGIQPGFRDFLATTTVVTQAGQFCVETGRWGDLDGDGFADSRDALAILTNGVGLPVAGGFDLTKADVDNDGQGNTRDALILVSHAVGLDIPGHRVLLPIAGTCATGTTPALDLSPDSVDVVPGQGFKVIVHTSDTNGVGTGGALNWRSLDPSIAAVDTAGQIFGVAPGLTRVVASLGPGLTDTVLVNVSGGRRVWHVNSSVAAGAGIQLGTTQYPYDDIYMPMAWVSEGDTVLLAPGVNLMDFNPDFTKTAFDVGVVVMGDTSAGKPRPVLRAPTACCHTLHWTNGGHAEVRNIEFEGLYQAIEVDFLDHLVIDNVTVRKTRGTINGVAVNSFVDTLVVTNSQFYGDTAGGGTNDGILVDASRLTLIRDVVFDGWRTRALHLRDIDSADVERATITGSNGVGILAYSSSKPDHAVRLANSFIDVGGDPFYAYNVRTVAMEYNRIRSVSGLAIPVEVDGVTAANATGPRVFSSVGDSIDYIGATYWSYFTNIDSLSIDSLWFKVAVDSLTGVDHYMQANYATITNSQLLGLNLDGIYHLGRRLTVDNSTFRGCDNACTWANAIAIESRALNDSGPQLTITNSNFWNLNYAVLTNTSNDSAGPVVVTNNVIDSVQYALHLDGDSLYVTDNVLTNVRYTGMDLDRSGTNKPAEFATIARNQIQCDSATTSNYGILYYNTPGRIENNKIGNCYYGIWATNATNVGGFYGQRTLYVVGDTVEQSPGDLDGIYVQNRFLSVISNNTVRNSPRYGIYHWLNILAGDSAEVVLDSNAVSGTGQAAIRLHPLDSANYTGMYNNVSNNTQDGFYLSATQPGTRTFRNGQLVGNGRWGVLSAYAMDLQSNWWGDAGGAGGANGNGGQLADSVSSSLVNVTGHLTAAPGNLPPLAPPFGFIAADRTAVRTIAPTVRPSAPPPIGRDDVRESRRAEQLRLHRQRRAEQARAVEAQRHALRREAEQRRRDGGVRRQERQRIR